MANLTDLLLATQDPSRRAAAEAQIKQAEQASVEQYLAALAQELASDEKPVIARQLSGLLLKNALASKDPARDRELKQRWVSLPPASRELVKTATVAALTSQHLDVGKAAAQVLAKAGAIEIPRNEWPQLVELLLQHITQPDVRQRQISLTTLGYLCEDLVIVSEEGADIVLDVRNKILTAVVQGMRDGEMAVKLEATRAFYHTILLADRNFKNDSERDFIVNVVIETCKTTGPMGSGADMVQTAAFECLVQIATEYYDYMLAYMNMIGPLTWETIERATEKVAIPAMEFWSTICDEELYLADLAANNQLGQRKCHNVIVQALPHLVPLLTKCLTRQQAEEDEDNSQNIATAAGTCLGLVAQVSGDACVDLVLAFVQQNFASQDWKCREAAVLAYGSIMEGPTSEKMRPLVEQSFEQLMVQALQDQSVAVRDTLAWTLGRMAQFHPSIVPVKRLTPLLAERLNNDVPRVAVNICWVIQVLAEAQPACTLGTVDTGPLSEFFALLAQQLLQATARPDATERNLRMAAYNALSVLVIHSANDCVGHMERLVQEMVLHLQASFAKGVVDRECELQGYICGVLTALTHRLREKISPIAASLMEQALNVIQAYQMVRGNQPVLPEEALLLIGAIITATGPNFERFMSQFALHLKAGLENFEEVQVCVLATGMIGDLCTALKGQMVNYCEPILEILYKNLQNQNVDRKIKSVIIECFGDIALAITGAFEQYLVPVVKVLQEASATRLQDGPVGNEEWIEYLNSLREGVLGAYAGIIHGLREAGKLYLFKEHVNAILNFVREICDDNTVSEPVMKAALGVIGDLILVFQQELMVPLQQAPFLGKLVTFANMSQDPSIRQTGQWLTSLVQKYSTG